MEGVEQDRAGQRTNKALSPSLANKHVIHIAGVRCVRWNDTWVITFSAV